MTRLTKLTALPALAILLAGCATAASVDEETTAPAPSSTTEASETSEDAIFADRTEGISNDAAIVNQLVAWANATCERANAEGVVESSTDGFMYSVLIPESARQTGAVGYHMIEDEFIPEFNVEAFTACSLKTLAESSEIEYGSPLGHVQITQLDDTKFEFNTVWLEEKEVQEYKVNDAGEFTQVLLLDAETGEEITGRDFAYGVTAEQRAAYDDYLESSTESVE